MNIRLIVTILSCGLAFNSIKSQSFFDSKNFSLTGSFGPGKILFYFDHTPTYISAADQEASEYSPSWSLKLDQSFWLNKRFDFSIGISYLTITEKTQQTAKPDWFKFNAKKLSQGFMHIVPSFQIKLPDERFVIKSGFRLGTASFIGSTSARNSSHSLGGLHADIDLETGASIRIYKRFHLEIGWIQGLTKYDYIITSPIVSEIYFKYHSFQFGIKYILRYAK